MANEVKTMGSRLGVIVKTIDGWDIRYDHWSAQTLGRDIALDGYEATLTRIRQMAPYGVDTPQEMKSAPWLEGTLFIDMTTKRIVWAEESEGCYLPRLINALIELTWPGWTAIWSPEGTRGTLRATGADTDIIYTDHSFKDLVDFDAASDMAPWTISNETDAFSCTTENNKTITWGNYIDLENIALLGPNKMHTLVNKVIQGCNEGKPWQWNLQTHNKQPEKGIHIDYINKTIKWWSIYEDDWAINPFNALWPGWTLHSKGDNYEWHENITGYKMRDWKQDVAQCKNSLTQTIKQGIRTNPIERLTGALAKQGVDMRIRPATFQFVPSRMEQPPERIFAYLDRLESDEPLPPARFINRDGEIIPACQ